MTDSNEDFHMMRVFNVESGSIDTGYQLPFAGELVFDPSNTVLMVVARVGSGIQFWGVSEG